MLIAKNLTLESVDVIAHMYVPEGKKILLVSYKDYAEMHKHYPEAPNSGPMFRDEYDEERTREEG